MRPCEGESDIKREDWHGRRGSFGRKMVNERHVHKDTARTKKNHSERTAMVITMLGLTIDVAHKRAKARCCEIQER